MLAVHPKFGIAVLTCCATGPRQHAQLSFRSLLIPHLPGVLAPDPRQDFYCGRKRDMYSVLLSLSTITLRSSHPIPFSPSQLT